ncbi:hypothetical protein AgCh_030074 [Apium graveolens]
MERSKWLREENDSEWEARIGRENNGARFSGDSLGNKGNEIAVRRGIRDTEIISIFKNNKDNGNDAEILSKGPNISLEVQKWPESDEDVGLNIEDRKRRRSGPITEGTMD